MTYEKTINRVDGEAILISVKIISEYLRNNISYLIQVAVKPKHKRIWVYVNESDFHNHVSDEEIFQSKVEAWQSIKPI